MTVNEFQRQIIARITTAAGTDREAHAMMRAIWEEVKGWSQVDVIVKGDKEVSDYIADKINGIADRVAAGEPLQYILGHAHFYGMSLTVSPAVLIPRPETAQLVDIIVDRFRQRTDLDVIDFCTGSGCIAIALARNLPFARVIAEDISRDALAVADVNVKALKCRVKLVQGDVLTLSAPHEPIYDIIVSNPPYIAEHERAGMSDTVTRHEPAQALFVPDNDPLKFYRPIALYSAQALRRNGALFLEINPLYVDNLRGLLSSLFDNVEIMRDMQGRERFAIAQSPLRS